MATLDEYRSREHWSFSALNQFLNICSLQFAFERVYRLERAFTPVALSFGSTFHRAMEWIHLVRKEGRQPAEKEAGELFQDLWSRQLQEDKAIKLEDGKTSDEYGAEGAGLLDAFLGAADPEEEVVDVSTAFAVPLIDGQGEVLEKPLVGELDCVVRKGGDVVVVDWKTSGRRWPKAQADKSLQPTAYLYAYRQLHGVDAPMRFDVVVKNKKPVVEQHVTRREPDQFHRRVELVKRVESMIAAEHFLPNEQGFWCAGCPYREACRAWHREAAQVSMRVAA